MSSVSFKILIVEDVVEERTLLANFLLNQNYSLYLAEDGPSAIDIAQKVQPDLILLDVFMPKYDGYTILRQMRAIPLLQETPVIFVTAAASPDERVKGLGLGAIDYITKPFDFEEISLRLDIHLKYLKNKEARSPATKPSVATTHTERLENSLFTAASGKLLNNLAVAPSLAELAKDLRTNTKRLNDAFKTNTGMTMSAYVRHIRMEKAKELLADSLLSINEIAVSLGFNSPANFSTAFRVSVGVSPREYRNREPKN